MLKSCHFPQRHLATQCSFWIVIVRGSILRESLTDFVKLIDDLTRVIENNVGRKFLVVMDNLDHVDHHPIRDIFANHWLSLS